MLSPEALSATAGVVLSLLMNYFPGLNAAFDRLSANGQRLAMAVLLFATALGTAAWSCPDTHGLVACLSGDWKRIAQAFLSALTANQATDRISPKPRTPPPPEPPTERR